VGVTVRNLGSTVPVSPYVQDLRNANIHAFCFLPLSQHALVLFEFPRQVSWCPGGRFTLFLPHISWELIVGRNGAHGGTVCQDKNGPIYRENSKAVRWSGSSQTVTFILAHLLFCFHSLERSLGSVLASAICFKYLFLISNNPFMYRVRTRISANRPMSPSGARNINTSIMSVPDAWGTNS
jgi:hypothetical protein